MKSRVSPEFIRHFRLLPQRVQELARKNYKLWQANPSHPSIRFKLVGKQLPIYSVRIGSDWRAMGVMREDAIVWFWIGSHAVYDKLVSKA